MSDNFTSTTESKKACNSCGAELQYLPGSSSLICDYCGHEEMIQDDPNGFEELELKPFLEKMGGQSHTTEITMIKCKSCGATQHIEEHYKSLSCVYCAVPLIIDDAHTEEWILPGAILPFQINHEKSLEIFSNWVKQLWFAPDKLKKASLQPEKTKGLYLPFWTFDAQLYANYTGERGNYYYKTVTYTTNVNGKLVKRNRQERRTKWSSTSGSISGFIDDTLINASRQTKNQIPEKIKHWRLDDLKSFNSDYLAGFVTEKYTIPLKDGHLSSTKEAKNIATLWAKQDISGDEQRVHSINIKLTDETFKHILLPIYISSYNYKGKLYHFYINGQTGNVTGDRPYSTWKIVTLILIILLVIAAIAYFSQQ